MVCLSVYLPDWEKRGTNFPDVFAPIFEKKRAILREVSRYMSQMSIESKMMSLSTFIAELIF